MIRQLALVAASALILAGCGSAPVAISADQSGSAFEAQRRTKKSASEFEHLTVNSVSMARDGGTIILKGYINRSTYVTLRFDNKLSSKTRGQIFITMSTFGGSEGTERALTTEEAAALAKGIRANLSRTDADIDAKLLERAADQLDAASDAEDPFDGLEIVSLDSKPTRCPCFTLTAKAGGTTVKVDFEGFVDPLEVTGVQVNGKEANEAQRTALRPALEKAAGQLKDKQLAARIKQVAKVL